MSPNELNARVDRLAVGIVLLVGSAAGADAAAAGQVRLGPLSAYFEIRHDLLVNEVVVGGDRIQEETLDNLAPRITLRASGWAFDPRVLTVDAGLGARFERGVDRRLDQERDSSGEVASYDLSLGLLPQNRFSLTLRAAKSDEVRAYPYALPTQVETRTARAELGFRRVAFPGSLAFDRTEFRETIDSPFATGRDSVQSSLEYRGSRVERSHRFDAFARRLEYVDRAFDDNDNRSVSADLRFGAWELTERVRRLASSLTFFERSGGRGQRTLALGQSAGLRHTGSLTSEHSLAARLDRADGARSAGDQVSFSWSSGARHQLYRSLESNLRLGANRVERDDRGQSGWRGDGSLRYRKRFAESGSVSIGGLAGHDERRLTGAAGEILVNDEPLVASFAMPLVLESANVVADTIVVTNEGGSILYQEGVDWLASMVGTAAEIRILPTGAIVDGQPLRVSYSMLRPETSRSTTRRSAVDLAVEWRGWNVYLRRSESSDATDPELPRQFRLDQSEQTLGARWRWQGASWSASADASRQRREDAIVAFDQEVVALSLAGSLGRFVTLTLGAQQVDTEFSRPARSRRQEGATIGLTWRPVSELSVGLRVDYREFQDSLEDAERYLGEALSVQWNYGQLSLLCSAGIYELERGALEQRTFRSVITLGRRL